MKPKIIKRKKIKIREELKTKKAIEKINGNKN